MNRPLLILLVLSCAAWGQATAIPYAHAHNDYEHPCPLTDALNHGFASIEVDIHLARGQLRVAHRWWQVRKGGTLEDFYLQPLRERVEANGGTVVPGGGVLTLLIDIKTDASKTWLVLEPLLERYRAILTRYTSEGIDTGAVMVILSGNRPLEALRQSMVRYAAYDGRLTDLGSGYPPSLMPLVSDKWRRHFRWRGKGEIPTVEREKLAALVAKAHRRGYRLRFWATPDKPGPAPPLAHTPHPRRRPDQYR